MQRYQKYLENVINFVGKEEKQDEFLDEMFKKIYDRNCESKANGSLMRISPWAFFMTMRNEDPLDHAQLIRGSDFNS